MTHEAKPLPLADATKATLYLLTGEREGKLAVAVALQDKRVIPGCQVTGVTTRRGVDLELLLTNARGIALDYLSHIIDQFQGTEHFLPRLISFTEMARELLAKEDIDVLKQLASEELTHTLDMLDNTAPSDAEADYIEQLLSRFRSGNGTDAGTGEASGKGGAE